MASWNDIERKVPELATAVKDYLDAHTHKTIATLRKDGSPRISGIEAYFVDGDMWFGAMGGSLKAKDMQRDPRFALHSGSDDPPDWDGDAKVAGRVEEITDPARKAAWFEAIGTEASSDESHLFPRRPHRGLARATERFPRPAGRRVLEARQGIADGRAQVEP